MRYVDTQNEGLNGNKYGMRASLAQQNYRVMSQDFVNPAVFTSVESVVGANASDSYERSSEAP